jgi:predicted MFS family arabinose efflux permease
MSLSSIRSAQSDAGATPAPAAPPRRALARADAGAAAPLLTRRFLLILVVQTLVGFSFSIFYILPKFLTNTLHATGMDIGLLNAVYGMAAVLAVPVVGMLLDRWGRAPVLKLGSITMACASFLFVRVDSTGPLLLALRAAQGCAFALAYNAATTMAADDAPAEHLGQAIGLVGLASLWTNAAAPAVAEIIGDRYGYTFAFLLSALFAIGAAVLARKLARPIVPQPSDRAPGFLTLLADRRSWPVILAVAICGGAFGAMFAFHQPFALSIGIRRVGGFFVAYTVGAIIVRIGFGRFIDRVGCYRVSVASLLLYGGVVFAMQWLTPACLVILALLFGVAHGLFYPAICAVAIEHVSAETRGTIMSMCNGAFNAGLCVSGLVFGSLAEQAGYPSVFLIAGIVVWGGVILLLGARARAETTRGGAEASLREPRTMH